VLLTCLRCSRGSSWRWRGGGRRLPGGGAARVLRRRDGGSGARVRGRGGGAVGVAAFIVPGEAPRCAGPRGKRRGAGTGVGPEFDSVHSARSGMTCGSRTSAIADSGAVKRLHWAEN
jgi:hypothetical protein